MKNSKTMNTMTAMTMLETVDLAPALKFAVAREKEPVNLKFTVAREKESANVFQTRCPTYFGSFFPEDLQALIDHLLPHSTRIKIQRCLRTPWLSSPCSHQDYTL
jgi:hypothetical protein